MRGNQKFVGSRARCINIFVLNKYHILANREIFYLTIRTIIDLHVSRSSFYLKYWYFNRNISLYILTYTYNYILNKCNIDVKVPILKFDDI